MVKELLSLLKEILKGPFDREKALFLLFISFLVFLVVIAGKMTHDNPAVYGIITCALLAFLALVYVTWLLAKSSSAHARNTSDIRKRIEEISKQWELQDPESPLTPNNEVGGINNNNRDPRT